MKKLYVVLLLFVLVGCLVSCQGADDTSTESHIAEQGVPTFVYSYELNQEASPSGKEIESPIVFQPQLLSPNEDLFFVDHDPDSVIRVSKADFLGEEKEISRIVTRVSYPMYPKEYGAYSVYTYNNSDTDSGTVHIRHDTKKPIYFHGRNATLFKELDFGDREAVVAMATDILKRYTSFEGYTLFVYEDEVYTSDGIVVEYNLTVDGQKTNCYVKMGIGYNRLDYSMTLTNDIEDVIKPYLSAKVDKSSLDAIAAEKLDFWYRRNANFSLEKYEIHSELMVLHGKLMARVVINPLEMRLTEKGVGVYFQGQTGLTEEDLVVPATSVLLLIEVASIEYVTE